MSSYWVNFASGGDPNGTGLMAWPAYDEADEPYLELGDNLRVKQHLLKPQLDFLDGLETK
jgi:carboxylesterase type B